MSEQIQELIRCRTKLRLGVNKINELSRLVYEIARREKISPEKVLDDPAVNSIIENKTAGYLEKFAGIKKSLLERRYPNASKEQGFSVYFSRLKAENKAPVTYQGGFAPERVFIESGAAKYPLAARVQELFGAERCELISTLKDHRKNNPPPPFDPQKRVLFIAEEKWDLVKPCPCTKNVAGCGYHIINLGFGCPYDCSYCYLQQYSNTGGIILPANIEDYFPAIAAYLKKYEGAKIRIGTGEFTDSLALDHITRYSKELVPYFKDKNAIFELKTKSANIENLKGLEHGGRTVIAWSLNSKRIAGTEELGAAGISERFSAAKRCAEEGYGIGFHFDPVIHYKGWEEDYEEVINELFDNVRDPRWISVGALRFHRALKDPIEARFPLSDHIYGELVLGADKKMRYYASLRKDIFNKMAGWIKKRNGKTPVYLCMEGSDMWRGTLGTASVSFSGEGR